MLVVVCPSVDYLLRSIKFSCEALKTGNSGSAISREESLVYTAQVQILVSFLIMIRFRADMKKHSAPLHQNDGNCLNYCANLAALRYRHRAESL